MTLHFPAAAHACPPATVAPPLRDGSVAWDRSASGRTDGSGSLIEVEFSHGSADGIDNTEAGLTANASAFRSLTSNDDLSVVGRSSGMA